MTIRILGPVFILVGVGVGVGVGFVPPASGQAILVPPASGQPILAPSPLEQAALGAPAAVAPAQRYDGVVPGPAAKNPLPAAPKAGSHLVWTGFQMTPTGSRVFLQTTSAVQFDVEEGRAGKGGKSTLAVRLDGCRIHMANNRRKIDTRYFATPVVGLSARQKGRNVEVRIALRETASAVSHVEPGPEGTQFVVLDFPPGKAAPEPTALQDMAKASGLEEQVGAIPADESDGAGSGKKSGKARP